MRAATLVVLLLALPGCIGPPEKGFNKDLYRSVAMHTVWIPLRSLEEVRKTCGAPDDKFILGCAVQLSPDLCILVTVLPPVHEYTGDISTHHSQLWTVLAHEFAHCHGWEHQPILIRSG